MGMAVFAALIPCVMRARHLAVRLAAVVLAIAQAGLSGVATVNMYYGYYHAPARSASASSASVIDTGP